MSKATDNSRERTVSVTEVKRSFAEILDEVKAGVTIRVQLQGVEVCVISPPTVERKKASEILAELRKQPPLYVDDEFRKDLMEAINSELPSEVPDWD
jgi:antitoxin (DNA-binding transcriptional repressor) of toxin-antitoxin stability system